MGCCLNETAHPWAIHGATRFRRYRWCIRSCLLAFAGFLLAGACYIAVVFTVILPFHGRDYYMIVTNILSNPLKAVYGCSLPALVTAREARSVCMAATPLLSSYQEHTVIELGQRGYADNLDEHQKETWRYFSAFNCSGEVCMCFKNRKQERWVGVVRSKDGLSFSAKPSLLLPSPWQPSRSSLTLDTHTLGVLVEPERLRRRRGSGNLTRVRERFLLIGGSFRLESKKDRVQSGVWVAQGFYPTFTNPPTSAGDPPPRSRRTWESARLIFDGMHPGCIERRNPAKYHGACEFDGRLSLTARHRGHYLLYARQNPALFGSRFVQLTTSTDLVTWTPFKTISIDGYAASEGDIYFFAAQLNPFNHKQVIALAPIVHNGCGCIALLSSMDGVRWTRPKPLLRVNVDLTGARTVSHPVAGIVVRDGHVIFYFHINVLLIPENGLFMLQLVEMARHLVFERSLSSRRRVVAYRVPIAIFRTWTIK